MSSPPLHASGARRKVSSQNFDNEDGSDSGSSDGTGSRSSKRRRRNSAGSAEDSRHNELPPDEQSAKHPARPLLSDSVLQSPKRMESLLPATMNNDLLNTQGAKHQPGSIIRMRLRHFVTYTEMEVFPGPGLNVGIGPNGSGKSSLICGIVLGLGSPPSVLGRSKDVMDYVKHGYNQASIEIELQGWPGESNPTIKRLIDKEKNKSQWWLNGQSSSQRQVLSLVKSFSIQVDNLCSVLPQDRVVEFAAMSAVELLLRTQHAAAPDYVSDWHEQLKTRRADQKKQQADESSLRETLRNLEKRQDAQRADVDRIRQRREVVHEVEMLEKMRTFARYIAAKSSLDRVKNERAVAVGELGILEREVAPSLIAYNEKKAYQERIDRVLKQKQKIAEKAEAEADAQLRKMNDLSENIKSCERKRDSEKKAMRESQKDKPRIDAEISRLRKAMSEASVEFDAPAYNVNIREKLTQIRSIDDEIEELKGQGREISSQNRDMQQHITDAENQVRNLQSQAGQQDAKLKSRSPDTARGWEWIKQHQDEFQSPIYGPPIVECSVQDKRYVDMIESLFQRNDFLAFTCTNQADVKKLQEQVYKTLDLKDISIRMVRESASQFQPPISDEDRAATGLTGWAIDYVTGPDPVLAMLSGEMYLYRTGVTLRDISNEQYKLLENSRISSWVTAKSHYTITRRAEYGSGASSTRVRDVRTASIWTSQGVDVNAENELKQRIASWNLELEDNNRQRKEIGEKITGLQERRQGLEEERKSLQDEKNLKQMAIAEYQGYPLRLAAQQSKRKEILTSEAGFRERFNALLEEEHDWAMQKADVATAYINCVDRLKKFQVDALLVSLSAIEARSSTESLAELTSSISIRLNEKRAEVETFKEQIERAKPEAKKLLAETRKLLAEDEAARNYYTALSEEAQKRMPDELELEIDSQRARLDLLHEGNPGAIKEYEERQKRIDEYQHRLSEFDANLCALTESISALRAKWEPVLDDIIGRISSAFSTSFQRMGCAGEVGILKSEDFDQWAVQIKVKFRENEPLSLLDNHRQSGGERSVSTIMYLMALQTLSRAPFRIVDEINQGMDHRNERMVHEMMVRAACEGVEDANGRRCTYQSFLITPKLLNNLKYWPGMAVHCIISGEGVTLEGKKVDFKRSVSRIRQARDGHRQVMSAA